MLKSKHVIPAIELLGIGSLTAVGLAVGGPIGAGVMGAIGLNLSSNLLEGAKTQLKQKWLNSEYGALNHDIQHALVRAFVNALNYLESEYFKTDPKQLPREEKKAIRGLFKSLRTDQSDPQRAFDAGTHLGALYAEASNFEQAWLMHNMLGRHPKLTPELRNRLGAFDSYLKDMKAKADKRARVVVRIEKPKDG